jgi:mRNA interferase MazF
MITYIPLTTQYRESPYEVVLPKLRFLNQDSYANVQGLGSVPKVRLERRLGKLSDNVMREIKNAILFALDLEIGSPI